MACEHRDRVRAMAEGELDGVTITGITVEVCRECEHMRRVDTLQEFTGWAAQEEWRAHRNNKPIDSIRMRVIGYIRRGGIEVAAFA